VTERAKTVTELTRPLLVAIQDWVVLQDGPLSNHPIFKDDPVFDENDEMSAYNVFAAEHLSRMQTNANSELQEVADKAKRLG
jgi:hypothetical protein